MFFVSRSNKGKNLRWKLGTVKSMKSGKIYLGEISIMAEIHEVRANQPHTPFSITVKNESNIALKDLILSAECQKGIELIKKNEVFGVSFQRERIKEIKPQQSITLKGFLKSANLPLISEIQFTLAGSTVPSNEMISLKLDLKTFPANTE